LGFLCVSEENKQSHCQNSSINIGLSFEHLRLSFYDYIIINEKKKAFKPFENLDDIESENR